MVTILAFVMILLGMIWLITHIHNKNCEFCERKMPIIQDSLMECEQELEIMHEKERKYKSQIDNMHKREMVITDQVNLINRLRPELYEVQRITDQYVANIEKYCELKATDDSWFYSLSEYERDYMYRLKHYLGVNEYVDKKFVLAIVRRESERVLKELSSVIEKLEDDLSRMNMQEMKQSQEDMKDVSTFLKVKMEHTIKSGIESSSRELQRVGGGRLIISMFYNVLKTVFS